MGQDRTVVVGRYVVRTVVVGAGVVGTGWQQQTLAPHPLLPVLAQAPPVQADEVPNTHDEAYPAPYCARHALGQDKMVVVVGSNVVRVAVVKGSSVDCATTTQGATKRARNASPNKDRVVCCIFNPV